MSSNHQHRKNSASTDRLPPVVYLVLVGFVAWIVLAAWGFAGPGYADVALTVVTGFLIVAIAIPLILWRVARANQDPSDDERPPAFAEWSSGQLIGAILPPVIGLLTAKAAATEVWRKMTPGEPSEGDPPTWGVKRFRPDARENGR